MKQISLALLAAAVFGQGRPPGPSLVKPQEGERMAWFGTLEKGLAEARRTNRPILFVAAAPHCHSVSGIW